MDFAVPLLFVIGISGSAVMIARKRFEEVLPVSLLTVTLILYISGLFGRLLIGYYCALAIACAFPVLILIHLLKRKNHTKPLADVFTPGFFIFLALYIFVWNLNGSRGFTMWDEISHWGPMVKETLRLNKFYSVPESMLSVHKDYPPIVSLFEYLWCKLSGGYRESYLYNGLQLLSFSLFFPMFSRFKWEKSVLFFGKLALSALLLISAPLILSLSDARFYQTIYTDCLLALLLAYSLSSIVIEKKISGFGLIRLSTAFSFMLLTKQMGIAFWALSFAFFLINIFIAHLGRIRTMLRKVQIKKILPLALMILTTTILVPGLFLFSWNRHVDSYDLPKQFSLSSVQISELPGIRAGTIGEPYQRQAMNNFLDAFMTRELVSRPVTLSFWQLMIMAFIAILLIGKYGKGPFENKQVEWLGLITYLGSFGYSLAMLLLYTFCFDAYEGPRLASFDRYMNTYVFAAISIAIMLFIYLSGLQEKSRNKTSIYHLGALLSVIWLVFLSPSDILNLKPVRAPNSVTAAFTQDYDILHANTTPDDKVYIISQQSDGYVTYNISYLLLPEAFNAWGYSLGEKYSDEDGYTVNLSVQAWVKTLISEKYGYLYLQKIDQNFLDKYSSVFEPDAEIKDKQLYKIIQTGDDTIQLKHVS